MLDEVLQLLYYSGVVVTTPITYLWNTIFEKTLIKGLYPAKVVVLGVAGGGYKTTLANNISSRHGQCHQHIKLDDCLYRDNWVRNTPTQFNENVRRKIDKSYGAYVVEGVYSDLKMPERNELVDEIIGNSELVVWLHLPIYISLWRKLFRSFKRAINVTEQGSCPEKWSNVRAMLKKTWYQYDTRYKLLNDMWEKQNYMDNSGKYVRVNWPYYFSN